MRLPQLLARLPLRWRWFPHNFFAHPISEVLYQLGARDLSALVHDATLPEGGASDEPDEGPP